ncbi:MAG TPA: DUF6786 family protein [Bacteroidota bacterium]|nr:DUF6786 family protein [Bacteroidota bacterium]
MKLMTLIILVLAMGIQLAVAQSAPSPKFGDDVAFLKKYVDVIVLSDKSSSTQVAVIPAYQCRVMTSTTGGSDGLSYGWVNRELIASGKIQPHINVYGGEDRFWIGPEGGQFSVFFKKGDPFDLEHWQTPLSVDTEPFEMVSKSSDKVVCQKKIELTNYSGTKFNLLVEREIHLLDSKDIQKHLGVTVGRGVSVVAYESVNSVRNTGGGAWTKQGGLLSMWILGMFNASPGTTITIPYATGDESKLGPVVNDTYFGKVPAERLVVKNGMIYFAADAKYRSKIGIPPLRVKPTFGSYDAVNHVLTLIQFTFPKGAVEYVNSMWEIQKKPFGGDVINSYNDGPPKPGAAQLGHFYELETSSPALALKPDESASHTSRTMHLQGPEAELDAIAHATLGVGLDDIKNGLKK